MNIKLPIITKTSQMWRGYVFTMTNYKYINDVPYLSSYLDDEGLHLDKLIDDDFLQAAKLLWQNGRYISALKLILSFVDTMTFLENGTTNGVLYQSWLDRYVDLKSLGITSEEVWEHRNSLLHMTTYTSRRVSNEQVARISPYIIVGEITINQTLQQIIDGDSYAKQYELGAFISAIMYGLENYVQRLNTNPEMFKSFLENYDEVSSDVRHLKVFEEAKKL